MQRAKRLVGIKRLFSISVITLLLFTLIPARPVNAGPALDQVLKMSALRLAKECAEDYGGRNVNNTVINTGRDYGSNLHPLGNDSEKQVVVGIAQDEDNGVMTCWQVLAIGIRHLRGSNELPSSATKENVGAWFFEYLTGTTVAALGAGQTVPMDENGWATKMNALIADFDRAIAAESTPTNINNDKSLRIMELVNNCYLPKNSNPGTDALDLRDAITVRGSGTSQLYLVPRYSIDDVLGTHSPGQGRTFARAGYLYIGDSALGAFAKGEERSVYIADTAGDSFKLSFDVGTGGITDKLGSYGLSALTVVPGLGAAYAWDGVTRDGKWDFTRDFFPIGQDYPGRGNDDGVVSCRFIRDNINDLTSSVFTAANVEVGTQDGREALVYRAGSPLAGESTTAALNGNVNEEPSCENSSFLLGWITCGIISGLASVTSGIFTSVIEPYLRSSPIDTQPGEDNDIFKVWSSMRTIANIILVFALLAVVFSQAIGGGMVDAYTAKKIMPRLLVAAILINISIYIVAALVDIFNVLGAGIGNLIVGPFKDTVFSKFDNPDNAGAQRTIGIGLILAAIITAVVGYISFASFKAGGGGTGATANLAAAGQTIWPFIHFILVMVLLPAAIVSLAIFATLIIRQGIILILTVTAPVAFAFFAVPNTEKYFKKWWETLTSALMVYPIITVLFSCSIILAALSYNNPTANGDAFLSNFIGAIVAFIIIIIPLLAIPFAFKLAGGILGNVMNTSRGAMSKLTGGVQGKYKEKRALEKKSMFEDEWRNGNNKFRQRIEQRRTGRAQVGANVQNFGNGGRVSRFTARKINGGVNPSQDALDAGNTAAAAAQAMPGATPVLVRAARRQAMVAHTLASRAGVSGLGQAEAARAAGSAAASGASKAQAAQAGAAAGRGFDFVFSATGGDISRATVAAQAAGTAAASGASQEAASTAATTASTQLDVLTRAGHLQPAATNAALAAADSSALAHDALVRTNGGNHTQASTDAQALGDSAATDYLHHSTTHGVEAGHTAAVAATEATLNNPANNRAAAASEAAQEHVRVHATTGSHTTARQQARVHAQRFW